jgi:hypothetical protein
MARSSDEELFEGIADAAEATESAAAPARLKARIYSVLLQRQAETGPLMGLDESHARGQRLCVFEQLVRIAPVGETVKSLNFCRVCHARVFAEHMENTPFTWSGCPYGDFKRS